MGMMRVSVTRCLTLPGRAVNVTPTMTRTACDAVIEDAGERDTHQVTIVSGERLIAAGSRWT